MEAAVERFVPVARRIMQQAANNSDNSVRPTNSNLPCHDWRVDEAVWIEIRGAQNLEVGATHRRRSRNGTGDAGSVFGRPAGGIFCY
jgi:hypothetical protein